MGALTCMDRGQKGKQKQYLEALEQTHPLTIKMETTVFSKMSVLMYQTTQYHAPEDNNLPILSCDLISHRYILFCVAVVVRSIAQMCLEVRTHTLAKMCSHSAHVPVRRLWMQLSMLVWWQIH
jgi:hypothetical protein